ncbi:MAG: hypothetical protein MK289_07725 [Trichodesmium sp. ALOHA_ZT_67]|nr:hypothetical protein [Trichodesmium sp. ALOHA_ZT_67]
MNLSKNLVLSLPIVLLSFTVNGCTISKKQLLSSPKVSQYQLQKVLTPEEIHDFF